MNFKNPKTIIIIVLTFVIVFLMNYIGNDSPNKLQDAALNGLGGVVGIIVGLFIWNRNKHDNTHQDFD
ncbi:hypothetical protein [Riemerella columbipharyngis]|uniref:Uncharacterized protein n=1 Tax=Riemerella columbipharyngis TaxID=1071918 RepID=A0A1G7CIJ2_9FLAO|nr:hypothetical protein [Riemerella columbipharyngis]SDE38506.1 hypothetical protein SAMN05421544_10839 [Riemerella columbipharyngis]